MTIDLGSLSKAIAQLEEAISYANSDLAKSDPRLALHLRAAAIQAFEFKIPRFLSSWNYAEYFFASP